MRQNGISKAVQEYIRRFKSYWKQKEDTNSCTINSELEVKLNSQKGGRSNTTQKQSQCLTFAYDNT